MSQLKTLRQAAGREHLPFETVIGLRDNPDLDTLRRLRDIGMSSGVSAPFAFTCGWQSTMEQKRAVMERFAEQFIQPLAADAVP